MYTFFEYCYYRIHSWYIMHKVDRTPRIYSTHWVSFGQTSNVITLICPLCYCLNIKVEFLFIFFPIHIIHCWLNYSFLLTEKKYFYLVFSILIGLVCIWFFKDNISFNTKLI